MGTNSRQNRRGEKAFQDHAERCGEALIIAERRFDALLDEGIDIQSLRVRVPQEDGQDYLVTVRALVEAQPSVGFHGGDTLQEALTGTLNRLYNRTMKWKDDEYAR